VFGGGGLVNWWNEKAKLDERIAAHRGTLLIHVRDKRPTQIVGGP